ncbi:MAG: response regulator transcription factor [Lewinellaceae bacterium]|nr:response regulator transcription factor [Lewinellaceae bacterium]
MHQINAIIVDDEASAVLTLRGMLEEFCPMVHVIHIASSVEQGVFAANQYRPEVVFLDIEMHPNGNGFDFLEQTNRLDFGVIFTTAHAQYAVRAINATQPWAYLVKPYKAAELIQAVQTAVLNVRLPDAPVASQPRGIILSDMRKGNVVVRYTDLICCLSDGSCSVFHYYDEDKVEQLAVYRTMRDIEAELPGHLFCRVHHGAVVNMAYIRRYERIGRSGKLYLVSNLTTDVSTQKMEHFTREFDLFLKGGEPLAPKKGR